MTGARFPGSLLRTATSPTADDKPQLCRHRPRRINPPNFEMESAELEARIAAAHEKAAVARRNTKLLEFESIALDRKSGILPGSHTSLPKLPPTTQLRRPFAFTAAGRGLD
jgi:hypothetical protein